MIRKLAVGKKRNVAKAKTEYMQIIETANQIDCQSKLTCDFI